MLKEKFDGAHEVKQKRKNGRRMLLPKYHKFGTHQDTDLVYLEVSPDYCEYDVKKGSLATKGRECDPVSLKGLLIIHQLLLTNAFYRLPRGSMVATCCAATGATPRGGRGGQRGASASSTGAATWSARSA